MFSASFLIATKALSSAEEDIMNTLGLAFIFVGFIVAALGCVNYSYGKRLNSDRIEKFEATVTKIRTVSSTLTGSMSTYCPEVVYSLYGIEQKAHYASVMNNVQVCFGVGDKIKILVDPQRADQFFLENDNFSKLKNNWYIIAIGASVLALGIIIAIGG